MRTVGTHNILEDKMDEAVTHYINTHQATEPIHIDTNGMPMSVSDDGSRVSVMHQQGYSSQICRQVSVSEQVGETGWNEELLDEGRIAAFVAHLANQRATHTHHTTHHKVPPVRNEVDTSVILDGTIRFNGQHLDQPDSLVVQLPPMPTLPPLQEMKRCQDPDWLNKKESPLLQESDSPVLELAGTSPAQHKQSKKSLPHKKRISRKLKRNGSSTPQQELVVLNCSEPAEQILPDNFVGVHQPDHHLQHEVRPILICQICGEFYGEEQLKFYHHLKQHYEPHPAIIIENPVSDLVMDKMTNTCIVDNVPQLPDSIVELSLESTKTMYQSIDKHILYTSSSDKTLNYNTNKVQYSMANMDRESEKELYLAESLDKLELYNCAKCPRTFRKQKQCETHMREAHSNNKLEDMNEFSEPEDLMAGIQVCYADYDRSLLPTLTVDSGHVTQEHHKRNAGIPSNYNNIRLQETQPLKVLKEEVLQRILENEVTTDNAFTDNIIQENDVHESTNHSHDQTNHNPDHNHDYINHDQENHIIHSDHSNHDNHIINTDSNHETHVIGHTNHDNIDNQDRHIDNNIDNHDHRTGSGDAREQITEPKINKNKKKELECTVCGRTFAHRNSLLYHTLSHVGKQHLCRDCGNTFYTRTALKVHKRTHSGDKPYKCNECGRDFRQVGDLKYHQISLHSNEKHFKCDFCGKEFARKYSLNVHRRIHTGERNYECHYCNKTFRASSYRLAHMRTHTGDRPYKCEQCEKCFRAAFDLRRHMLVHDKMRLRLEENKHKQKEPKKKTEIKQENTEPKTTKKVALASTTRLPNAVPKKVAKTKKSPPKKGAPNVTIDKDFKADYPEFETRPNPNTSNSEYIKFKDEYDISKDQYKQTVYKEERDIATLRPIKVIERTDDAPKIQVFSERSKDYNSTVGNVTDMRHLERDVRNDVESVTMDSSNVFLERLTALYNITA